MREVVMKYVLLVDKDSGESFDASSLDKSFVDSFLSTYPQIVRIELEDDKGLESAVDKCVCKCHKETLGSPRSMDMMLGRIANVLHRLQNRE